MRRLVSAVAFLGLISCGGGGTTGPAAVVATLTITPAQGQIDTLFAIGSPLQLNITAKNASGATIANPALTFSSSNPLVAAVNTTGTVTAAGNGSATITVTAGSVSDSRLIRVRQKTVKLDLSPGAATMVLNGTMTITAQPRDSRSNVVTGLGLPAYVSSNTDVATVTATGVVKAVSLGSATVTGTLTSPDGVRTGVSTITVTDQITLAATVTLTDGTFEPPVVDILSGGTVTFNNPSGVVHNVTFTGITGQDIGDHASGTNRRTFTVIGNFDFHCSIHGGMNGTVIVH